MKDASERVLRIYVEARTTHLERAKVDGATVAYFRTSYDFDQELASAVDSMQIGLPDAFRLVRSGRYSVVEVNEPLMLSAWPALLSITAAHALSPRRARSRLVSYAIENGDVASWLSSKTRLPMWIARPVARRVARLFVSRLHKLAFGTEAARARYEKVLGRLPVQSQLFTALEPECECLSQVDTATRRPGVVFVGAFEPRKGMPELMAAWDSLGDTDLTLTILGKGPLEAKILSWNPSNVRIIVDPDRYTIHQELKKATTLVLLSQPAKRWQEQIGLPLLEGLSHGCEIVTTSETGLAPWLASHGHRVMTHNEAAEAMGDAIASSARSARPPQSVLSTLPTESGRQSAADWLHKI